MANTKVQSEQIEDGSITADKLADGTIVAAELADNAVTTAKINADAVTGAKIADDAIDSEHYTDGSIDTAHIADAQITVAKMAANSVDSDQYVDGSIDTVHLGDLQVTTAKIANGNISTAKIADNAVTSAKLDTNIDIAGTLDVTGATTLDANLSLGGSDANDAVLSLTANTGNWVFTNVQSNRNLEISDSDGTGTVFTIDTSGNVGIGQAPNMKLNILHADQDGLRFNTANDAETFIDFGDTDDNDIGRISYDHADNSMSFRTSNEEKLTITNTGKVGVGNLSPTAKLDLGTNGVTRNATYDVSANAYISTSGGAATNTAASIPLTLGRDDNASTGDEIGLTYNFDDGGWSSTAGIFARVENASNAYTALDLRTWGGGWNTGLTVDSSGDVGIGTTSPEGKFEIEDGGTSKDILQKITLDDDNLYGLVIGNDSFSTTSADGFAVTVGNAGVVGLQARGSGSQLQFRTANHERMRINSIGGVAINNTSPHHAYSAYGSLEMGHAFALTAAGSSVNGNIMTNAYISSAGNWTYTHSSQASTLQQMGNGLIAWYRAAAGTADNTISWSESMRINADGNVLVGKNAANSATVGFEARADGRMFATAASSYSAMFNRTSSHGALLIFAKDDTQVGSISTNANSLPSDRNFKRDIEDLNIGLDLVTKLKPVSYNYKIDEDDCPKMFGLIAQDLEQSLEEVGVDKNSVQLLQHKPNEDEKESDYALDYLKLTPILIKSIQEQQEQIEQLKTEIEALKS